MIDMTGSSYERRVGLDRDLPLESLLAEGEAMPPEDQRLLSAMMSAYSPDNPFEEKQLKKRAKVIRDRTR